MSSRIFILLICAALLVGKALAGEIKNDFELIEPLVPVDEIRKGGPRRDGIQSITDPDFVHADDADFLREKDRVLGISLDEVQRAYPINILNYHELVNDLIGERAILVSWCPLCGTGMVFESSLQGIRLNFGVSGLLYNSDVLMYDRNTDSLWSQIMGQAINGRLKGLTLETLPVSHTTWREWRARYPNSDVLKPRQEMRRNYRVDPYRGYSSSGKLFMPVSSSDDRYRRKEIVMGVEIDGAFKAYPFEELEKSLPSFTDEFQGRQLQVVFDENNETARIVDKNGDEVVTIMAYWFAWYAFHPATDVYTAPEK